jgi:hypothetical protein
MAFTKQLLNAGTQLCLTTGTPSTTTISVLARHSKKCAKRDDFRWKRYRWVKRLYIYGNGRPGYMSAQPADGNSRAGGPGATRQARVNIPRQSRGLYDVSRSKRLERGR